MILEYYCTRPDAIRPTRANPSDAGLDVHFNPDDGELKGVYLEPGESKLFSTGLKFGVPHGYMLEVKNRSGNASKRSLLVGACVIDSGYNGEVFVNLHNIGSRRTICMIGTLSPLAIEAREPLVLPTKAPRIKPWTLTILPVRGKLETLHEHRHCSFV